MIITIKDETFAGKVLNELNLNFKSESATIKDIIEQRVSQEVENYNQKLSGFFNGLIEPNDAEKTLNGYKLKPKKTIDAEKQIYIALDAFLKNGYFILVDNLQAESLEQEITLTKNTTISFVKLTPLIGG
ncbi:MULTISPECIES: hypothetical protein [Flavobacterium]|uniref:Uncharacterized protein n=1 Tax=Flavobacterium piscisymbiosum TaxID=2893753 RepID=A0ABS8M872_9FLAO|nr:hypothetical protein [Flavobacterium sp. F-30]MCC9061695.1 hypothetical protein [Flavobacterium sp. F-30]